MQTLRPYSKLELPSRIIIFFGLVFYLLISESYNGVCGQSVLENACKHNEFRCQDGSACLKSEKLCNNVEDCPGGEDESGNEQWDCSRTTLSTECGRSEFRCRFGGCVPRTDVCNGVANCWGGSDESFDMCEVGGRPRPRPKPSSPPTRPTTRPPKPTPRPTPPRTRAPTPRPRPATSPAPDPVPPRKQTPSPSGNGCPTPPIIEGSRVECQHGNFQVNCGRGISPEGTIATYSCRQFWEPPTTGSKTASIICQNGAWGRINRKWGCNLLCGKEGPKTVGLIVGGVASDVGRWPWHVGFYHEEPPNSGKFDYFCGGSLISRRAILTAAHCLTRPKTNEKRNDRIMAGIGKYNRTYLNNDGSVQIKQITEIDIQSEYSVQFFENDIAIAWLDSNVQITDRVRPVCLPTYDDGVEPGLPGTLAGWGRWADRGYPEQLQEVVLPVKRFKECRDSHKSLESLSRSTTFCAGYQNGTSACDGDSGGGLMFEDRGKWFIQGIVSAGVALRAGGCDPNYYTVFTRVEKYRTWIERLLDRKDTL